MSRRWLLVLLSTLGLVLSIYLSWHHLMGGAVIGCDGGSSCDHVLSSRWSTIAGILPVSGLAAGVYLAILLGSFYIGPDSAESERRFAWSAILILASAAAGSAVWFIVLQLAVTRAFCPWCMAAHIISLLLAILIFRSAPAPRSSRISIGILLSILLATSQSIFFPPSVSRDGQTSITLPTVDPHNVPLVGSADAKEFVYLLFDYRCNHCQKIHAMLDEVIRQYDGKIAFVLCPTPLNNRCNPYISRQVPEFKDSCELARISIAVWFADRVAFNKFDRWMFTPDLGDTWHPRTLESVQSQAIHLLGQSRFDSSLTDPRVDQYLQTCLRIYGNTINYDQGTSVPKLVYRNRWLTPEPNDSNDLTMLLRTKLGVELPIPEPVK